MKYTSRKKEKKNLLILRSLMAVIFTLASISCANSRIDTDYSFWSREMGPPGGGSFLSAVNGDFNGDSVQDIAGGSEDGNGIRVWHGKGVDKWVETEKIDISGKVTSLCATDLNMDGFVDLIAAVRSGISGIYIWYSDGKGGWQNQKTLAATENFVQVVAADINNDGLSDVLAANIGTDDNGGVYAWLNSKDGEWSDNIGPALHTPYSAIQAEDFNGDRILDIVAASFGNAGKIEIWLGNKAGSWSPARAPEEEAMYNALLVDDFNTDGKVDLAASAVNGGISVWKNNGAMEWSSPSVIEDDQTFISLASADFTDDGEPDIAAGSARYEGITIFKHTSGAGFSKFDAPISSRKRYYDVKTADIDGNNKADLIAANTGQGIHLWYQGGLRKQPDLVKLSLTKRVTNASKPKVTKNTVFKTFRGIEEYKIGKNDRLRINIWTGLEKKSFEVKVQTDGTLFIPFLGITEIVVKGMTQTELKIHLLETLKKYLKKPSVEIEITKYDSKFAFLLGEVRVLQRSDTGPGKYALKGKTSVVDFISTHGGASSSADLRNVQVIKKDGTRMNINLFKAIFEGGTSHYPPVDNGDTIFIGSRSVQQNRLFVLGEVGNPGLVEFSGQITLLDAISKAGGLTKDAVTSRIFIARGDLNAPEIVEINLDEILKEGKISNNIYLENSDSVYIPRRFIAELTDFVAGVIPLVRLVESFYIVTNL